MEINVLVELYSKPIITIIQDNDQYKIVMIDDNIKNNNNNYNIDDVIFLLFVNDEHYNLLIQKK